MNSKENAYKTQYSDKIHYKDELVSLIASLSPAVKRNFIGYLYVLQESGDNQELVSACRQEER